MLSLKQKDDMLSYLYFDREFIYWAHAEML